ncbi:MAG: glycosyltransferase family 2 protein, partial [Patescibacteria group bacterium]|nr:glycosyltransferase family 2 protein [Patescibacteria group bacterium]
MNNQQSVSIIILNWNGKNDTLRCLESIAGLTKKNCRVDVYIVDNGSTDDSVKAIQHVYKTIHLIQNKENKGFAEGNNIGMRHAIKNGTEYIWLLNNDTIVEKNSLIELLSVFNDSNVGIASSKIYFMKGHEFHHDRYKSHEKGKVIWYAGGIIDWNNVYGFHNGVDEVDVGQYDQECETEYA